MSWAFYLEHLVLLSGLGGFAASMYFRHKQNYFQQLFKDLQKCQKYHLDYIQQLSHLPLDKKAIVFGTARSHDPNILTISKSVIKKREEENRLWNCELNSSFDMEAAEGKLQVTNPSQKVLAFNWLKGEGQSAIHEERILYHNEPVCIYGTFQAKDNGSRRIIPQIVMGGQHEKLLQYLDAQIVQLSSKGKTCVLAGTVLFGMHFCYKMWQKHQQKTRKMQAMLNEEGKSQ